VTSLDYAQTLRELTALSPLGIQPGLDRMAEVLRRLGSPEQRFPAVHIAGTNGKGSTSAYAATIAQCAARQAEPRDGRPYAIGLYTSPHLHRLTERIRFSQAGQLTECPPSDLAQAVAEVFAAAAAEPTVALTFFEVLTAAAFLLFARVPVDLAIIETGLGGRLDATRLCEPLATVVTSIGLDHMDWLGPTLTEIAAEKAGIFRRQVPALCAAHDQAARTVLIEHAQRLAAPLWLHPYHDEPAAQALPLLDDQLMALLPLAGAHQQVNASLAVSALSHVRGPLQPFLSDRAIVAEGLHATSWPGRIERVLPTAEDYRRFADREIILDAAHNPEGASALADWLHSEAPRPLTVLCGVVVGKLATEMAAPLRTATTVLLCRPPTPRGLPAVELAKLPAFAVGQPIEDHHVALLTALAATPIGGRLLVYGSIFLVGAVRAALLNEPTDELLVQDPGRPTTPPVAPTPPAPAARP
jgi:dihydrofolate synthase/folylpolyglutamate synthase